VWAVGDDSYVAHFNGATWTTSKLSKGSALSGVWASGPNDAWAVGNFGVVGRYVFGVWTAITLPGDPSLFDVHGTGPTDVWAVGTEFLVDGVIKHWNGLQWSNIPVSVDEWLEGVWAASSDDVWVVGRGGVILRGDAQGFSPVSVPVATDQTQGYWDVWGSSPNDVWILGSHDTLHFDGSTWTRFDPMGGSIAGRSATDMVAVDGTSAKRWDGTAWKEEFSVKQPSLSSAWAASPDDVWFVGEDGAVMRAVNGALTRATLGKWDLDVVWGSSATDIWISTYDGVYRGDGSTFCPIGIPVNGDVIALSGTGPNDVWAMTSDGAALHFDGKTWTTTSTDLSARSVLAFSPTDVWASGEDLRHWDGTSWTYPPKTNFPNVDPSDSEFGPLWGSAPDDVWVEHEYLGGDYMAHWDGTTFTQTQDQGNFGGTLSGSAKNDIWSFGFYVRRFDGASWSTVPSGRLPIEASVVTSKDVWAVGYSGLIVRKTK